MCSWFEVGPPVGHEYKKEDSLMVGPFSSLCHQRDDAQKMQSYSLCSLCLLARHDYDFRLYKNLYPKEVPVPASHASPPGWCVSFKSIQFYIW